MFSSGLHEQRRDRKEQENAAGLEGRLQYSAKVFFSRPGKLACPASGRFTVLLPGVGLEVSESAQADLQIRRLGNGIGVVARPLFSEANLGEALGDGLQRFLNFHPGQILS